MFKKSLGTEKVIVKTDDPAPEVASPDPEVTKEIQEDNDFSKSASVLEELRNSRNESDIPLNDAYWEYRNSHQLVHGKHSIRTDETQLIKGKPVDKSKLASE